MSEAVALLLKQANQLDSDELEALLERLKALKSVSAGTDASSDKAVEMYRCLSEAVFKARAVRLMPLKVFASQKGWREFVLAAEEAESFIEELEKDRIKKLAVRKWCCNLIVQQIIERHIPFNRQSMTWGLLNLSSILDTYFPGYMVSGVLPHALKSLYAGTKRKFGVPE